MLDIDQVVDNLDDEFIGRVRGLCTDPPEVSLLEFTRLAVSMALTEAIETQQVVICPDCLQRFTLKHLEERGVPCLDCMT